MENLKIEACLERIQALETIIIAVCAAIPPESSRQVMALIHAAEKDLRLTKQSDSEYLKGLRDHFSPYIDALQTSMAGGLAKL